MFLYASIHDRYIYQILILINNSSHAIQSIRTMFSYVTFRQRWSGFGLIFSSSS
ncbi:TPA: hypothetical protein ACNIHX_003261 [Acinetobacter baumannii]|uniref:hypothetical protein n=1 Tax=Acinetobacter baumannii TaxID=470 RepID=UPI000AE9D94D|nr:hypothetical protein [Acinetobacter baumannii]MDC4621842.1 hypothetical protein [Acinetobacter baumannii]MDC4638072.1 hypothetical protein [Acinetobacter baumannii]MDC5237598.1 hypothetical protein [Acinetobacter baumannii]MDV7660349.1 hypothetical protein [Acinetobacter baumannii]